MASRKKSSKKQVAKRAGSKKKTAARKVSRKPASRKKTTKKTAAKKKSAGKKTAKKKVSRKQTSRKKQASKSRKKTTRKKPAKKKAGKQKATRKKVVKKTSKKKSGSKKAAKKKVSSKKVGKKKTSKKRPAKKKSAKKTAGKKSATKKTAAKTSAKRSTKKAAAKKASSKTTARKASVKKTSVAKKAEQTNEAVAGDTPVKKAIVKTPPKRFTGRKSVAPPMNPADHRPRRPRKRSKSVSKDQLIHGIAPYKAEPGEEYMNDQQLEHFRNILEAWKRELMEEVDRTVHHMQDEASNFPDPNDRATQESEFSLELRTRDRERKLLKKIDQALLRVDEGEYGYCVETGEEIGLKRLEARPVATLSVEAQERREVAERQYRDSDDRYR